MKKAMLVFALIMGIALVAGPIFAQTAPDKWSSRAIRWAA